MQEYDLAYEKSLESVLFQKKRTSQILEEEKLSQNLRAHNCKMYQVCEVVERSLSPQEITKETLITGKFLRCEPTPLSELGGLLPECSSEKIKTLPEANVLWSTCKEQAEERIQNIEVVTEAEVVKSYATKNASNFVGYLMKFNQKLDKLALDMGDMLGKILVVTRKITCVQGSCQ